MNDTDSKKLEGEKCDKCGKRYLTVYRVPDSVWENVHPHSPAGLLCPECCDEVVRGLGSILYWEAELGRFPTDKFISKVKEQDREIERLRLRLDGWVDLSSILDYQRRHRKWALEECRTWQRHFCFYKDDAVRFHSNRADKAETRIKELEQELLWAVEASEQADAELVQLRKYNDELQGKRAAVYNEGVEDGKRQAEKEKA